MASQEILNRLTELELGYMGLERLVEELSGVVADQQKTIAALSADLLILSTKSEGFAEGDRVSPHDERPPHY